MKCTYWIMTMYSTLYLASERIQDQEIVIPYQVNTNKISHSRMTNQNTHCKKISKRSWPWKNSREVLLTECA